MVATVSADFGGISAIFRRISADFGGISGGDSVRRGTIFIQIMGHCSQAFEKPRSGVGANCSSRRHETIISSEVA